MWGDEGDTLPCDKSHDACDVLTLPPRPVRGQTDACENVTFPQLLLRAVNILNVCFGPFGGNEWQKNGGEFFPVYSHSVTDSDIEQFCSEGRGTSLIFFFFFLGFRDDVILPWSLQCKDIVEDCIVESVRKVSFQTYPK